MGLVPERRTGPELMDMPPSYYTVEEHEGTLADIRLVNRCLGDVRAIRRRLEAMAAWDAGARWTVLDVATGAADLPHGIAEWARKCGARIRITAVDVNPHAVRFARRTKAGGDPAIRFAVADGLDLPFRDKSFDFVLCSKTLHHFTEPDARRLIRGMARVARRGYIVLDLRRSWVAYLLIYVLTRIFTANRLSRFDGPMSVLKSFTPAELASLASGTGTGNFTVSREPLWHMMLSGNSGGTGV
jgi:SAM-dependent methyltransferase